MRIIFISNYMSHHQYFLSEELYKQTSGKYTFIATEPITEERIKLGWPTIKSSYLVEMTTDNAVELQKMIMEADAVILGSAPYYLIKNRIRNNKLTFTYGERPYKKKPSLLTLMVHWVRYISQYHHPNVYRLCASAFSPIDYARTNTYVGKSYRWGYFTEVKEYDDFETLYSTKTPNSILWCGRLIDWKHPEIAIEIAKRLKKANVGFKMDLIGNGYMAKEIAQMIKVNHLDNEVTLHNSMSPMEVREYMEKSSLYLFTSDRQEGWGAVLNEAMNSGCAVVANSAIGSVPYLIKNRENGFIYEDGQIDQLFAHVRTLLQNEDIRHKVSVNAYSTMLKTWNPHIAAARLIELIATLQKQPYANIFTDGPCSIAPMLKDNWYKELQ